MSEKEDIGSAATLAGMSTQSSQPGAPDRGDSPPSVVAERYEILGLLGAGGMGRVYRARDRKLDEVVALKMLRRELVAQAGMLERFRQEVKLARRVTSQHVVRTFDLGDHGDDQFLTMEYIDGRSLAKLLDDGALAMDEVLQIARAACAGMAAAHAANVLHRDLKPDNILVAKTGRIAITDFGIARAAADPGASQERFAGTPAYMAPEQVEGREIGPAADVYAFGAILFEMATGRRPFVGHDPIAVAIARLREPAPDPRALRVLPDAFAELVLRCLAREPAARFRDGAELARALDALADARAATPVPSPAFALPSRTSRAVAILPLRAPGELAEIADGLTEEIIDALTATRELRVRPLASVRKLAGPDADSREIGTALDVDIVVDGSLRRRGDAVRIAARAIGVADGFQVWASHVDSAPERLLAASDEVARAIARALTVEIAVPARAAMDPKLIELYLEGKAYVRANWFDADLGKAVALLDRVLAEVPDHPGSIAALGMALGRMAFFGYDTIARAREISARAVAVSPGSGEAHLALGITSYSDSRMPEAGASLRRALVRAPGLVQAQSLIGGIVLEAGALEDAISHLEAAYALDPTGLPVTDLPRAYVYQGRYDDAEALLARLPGATLFAQTQIARFRMWRGVVADFRVEVPRSTPPGFAKYASMVQDLHRERPSRETLQPFVDFAKRTPNPRLRSSQLQFACEFAMWGNQPELALECFADSVTQGLYDVMWVDHCPLLEPLRGEAKFGELADVVRGRARAVISAIVAAG